ncbi:MAG TPA: inositol monophosphatase family protein [Patescibacteria group bacterium]|nr:inositol monophosphatase family protein [Patescibacteria group bacterium]
MNKYSLQLNAALDAAKKASATLLKYYESGDLGKVSKKGRIEQVSDADLVVEALIKETLEKQFPDYGFFGEEFGGSEAKSDYKWYVDPLCGSDHFIHGLTNFGFSIALTHKDELILGVCGLPMTNELFWAEKGKGAFMNDEPISVSKVSNLEDAMLSTHISVKFENIMPAVNIISKIGKYELVISGPFPYSSCNLARGRIDGHVEINVRPVHRLAGTMIVVEAGGKWTRPDGKPATIFDNEIILSNKLLHDDIVKVVNS